MMATDINTPRVWIGCLSCYNAGRLTGQWFDATEAGDVTTEALHEGRSFGDGPHEELWVMDHENFGPMLSGECSPMHAQQLAEIIDAVAEHQRPAFMAWFGDQSRDLDDDLPGEFIDAYAGEWDSLEDYAASYLDDTGELESIPEHLRPYFDVAAYARDLRLSGDVWTTEAPGHGVFVFHAR